MKIFEEELIEEFLELQLCFEVTFGMRITTVHRPQNSS